MTEISGRRLAPKQLRARREQEAQQAFEARLVVRFVCIESWYSFHVLYGLPGLPLLHDLRLHNRRQKRQGIDAGA